MKSMLLHTSRVTNLVHDELIRWVGGLLKDAGLEAVDVWGRFPPEGTIRSHLVLFPYRVGPEPKNLENARGATLMTRDRYPSDKVGRVPTPWRNLGSTLMDIVNRMYPDAGQLDTPARPATLPFPFVDDLPKPLRDWYASKSPEEAEPWVLEEDGDLYARPPALSWRPGVAIGTHYIAVAGDAGRGVSDRTSDAPPLSLAALSCLTVGIQVERVLKASLPPMPYPDDLKDFLLALREACKLMDNEEYHELGDQLEQNIADLEKVAEYSFGILPMHDLSMHEFALLTQALQRPLQAVLNFRLMFSFGDYPVFEPSSVVSFRYARNKKNQ